MLQTDSHLNCLCVMARLIEALAIFIFLHHFDESLFLEVTDNK